MLQYCNNQSLQLHTLHTSSAMVLGLCNAHVTISHMLYAIGEFVLVCAAAATNGIGCWAICRIRFEGIAKAEKVGS